MQAFLNAIISLAVIKASEYDVANALRWLSGSLNGVKLSEVLPLGIVVCAAGCGILLLNRQLTMLQMGESHAVTLGVKSKMVRLVLILLSLLLVAFATSATGPIASVAFLAGPIAARLCGGGRTNMLSSALVGSVFGIGIGFDRSVCTSITLSSWCRNRNFGRTVSDFLLLRMNKKSEHV